MLPSDAVGRLVWMDRVRGGSILAVVILHAESQAVRLTGGDLPLVHALNQVLSPVRMPLLVLLSGVLLAPALAKPPGRYLHDRIRTLLWPYVVWSLVDIVHLQARLLREGNSLEAGWVLRLLYDPPTYLWFLAYLFAFHCLALLFAAPARTLVACGLLAVLAVVLEPGPLTDAERFAWLFAWFLIGDVLGRTFLARLPRQPVSGGDLLGTVGRHSVVFYASHLTVAIAVTDFLGWLGVTSTQVAFVVAVVVPMAVAALLAAHRSHLWVAALFVWPAGAAGPQRTASVMTAAASAKP